MPLLCGRLHRGTQKCLMDLVVMSCPYLYQWSHPRYHGWDNQEVQGMHCHMSITSWTSCRVAEQPQQQFAPFRSRLQMLSEEERQGYNLAWCLSPELLPPMEVLGAGWYQYSTNR